MTARVVGISASPRRGGNTEAFVAQALAWAAATGAETELIRLSELRILDCDACLKCRTQPCHRDDDMASLLEKLLVANLVVVGTPILMNQASALLKRFQERMLPFQRSDYSTKITVPTLLVVTQAYDHDPGLDGYMTVLATGLGRVGLMVTETVREMAIWEPGQASTREASLNRIAAWVQKERVAFPEERTRKGASG